MKKTFLIFRMLLLYFFSLSTKAQLKAIKLWPGKIPGTIENTSYKEIDQNNANGIYRPNFIFFNREDMASGLLKKAVPNITGLNFAKIG